MQFRFEADWHPMLSRGYFYNQCQYRPVNVASAILHFYVIYFPDEQRRNFYYCYCPFPDLVSPGQPPGYWCRCMSPNHPGFDASQFSVLPISPTGPTTTPNTDPSGDGDFGPFQSTRANFPGFPNEPLPNLAVPGDQNLFGDLPPR